ncbi:ATP-binding protein [Pseudorhodoplanes sp.]|uniref:ATP-binding protein n=1 Tax=Pseudorhodoplanes sp. TaxID=1934341 RepID=UPI00391BA3A3
MAAAATVVELKLDMDYKGNIRIAIADNGTGMDRDGLLNAMKYGSARRPNPASLGKFGLGLKTASTAFCRRLSVISRDKGSAPLLEATWDLDHVVKRGKWELLLSDNVDEEAAELLNEIAPKKSGTVVLWTKIDRMFGREYKNAGGAHAQNALMRAISGLKEHLSMVYQRFLDPKDTRAPNLEIRVNGDAVQAWDPFCEGVSDIIGNEVVPTEMGSGKEAEFSVRAFILPRKEEFPNEAAARRAKLSNERQGLYIYRENRLIHEADWLGMYSKEPHGTLLRVEFSFDHRLDEAFHIDIKKSQIILNEDLWNWLKDEFLTAPRREANNRYRTGQKAAARKKAEGSHDTSNQNIASKESEIDSAEVNVKNPETGEVLVTNKQGTFKLKLRVEKAHRPGEVYVQPVDGLDDGALFSPAIIDGHKAVKINTSHPYYHKVYVPNLSRGVTIQGMDSLLWGLCVAELSTISDTTSKHFEEMRFEVSRILRKLVEDLPDPEIEENVAA